MAFKTRLLATAAIPFFTLAGFTLPSIAAATVRPVAPMIAVQTDSQQFSDARVIKVQSEDEEDADARKKRLKKERAAKKKADQEQTTSGDEPVKKKKKKDANADSENSSADDSGAKPEKKKRKPRTEVTDDQNQNDMNAADSGDEPVKKDKKRKKKDVVDQQDQNDNMNASDSGDEPVRKDKKPKKKDVVDRQNQNDDMDASDQGDQPVKKDKKPRKKDVVDQQDQNNDMNAADSGDEPVKKEKKRKKNDLVDRQNQDDTMKSSVVNGDDNSVVRKQRKEAADAKIEERKKQRRERKKDTAEDVRKRRDQAEDPSKTTDTLVLPVENGAAVLDSDKDADNVGDESVRAKRKKQRENRKDVRVPRSDRDAQEGRAPIAIRPAFEEKGKRLTDFDDYDRSEGRRADRKDKKGDVRVIFEIDGRSVVRNDDRRRISRDEPIEYEQLSRGRIRETVVRPNGTQVVTIRNKYGEIIRRSKISRDGREVVITYSPELESGRERLYLRDAGEELPPMRLRVPVRDYIVDMSSEPDRDFEQFLAQPPVEPVERIYSLSEVKNSARIRDKVRRIDLDTITFDTGSAEISMTQASSLKKVGAALKDLLDKDPGETFLIEGHTDAVGSDESNLVLSDERAESVAQVLSDMFDIPAENLTTQGYGERFLKVETEDPERLNRRVTIRRISSLVRPLASNE